MKTNDGLALVFARNIFYRRLHYLGLAVFGMLLLTIGILVWVLIYVMKNQSPPLYFATDHVGRLIQVAPVQNPTMTTEEVVNWTIEAVQAAYSYDYLNFRSQLQNAQKYFTRYGWAKYMSALELSNNLVGVRERKLIGIAKIVDQPQVLIDGLLGGAYAWKIQVPVLMTYLRPPKYDSTNARVDAIVLTILVQRQPLLQSYKGLGIVQIVGQVATAPINQPEQASQ
jgi:intracellular multiplication protein IcmL